MKQSNCKQNILWKGDVTADFQKEGGKGWDVSGEDKMGRKKLELKFNYLLIYFITIKFNIQLLRFSHYMWQTHHSHLRAHLKKHVKLI